MAAIVRHEIGALRLGEREHDVRHHRSGELPDIEQQIAEQCYEDDFGVEELFTRARSLIAGGL